ncbi:MAG TPA: hypothetical protein VH416_04515 [Gaiellaceae bacterium]|jgi:hypothetical protein
MLRRLLLVCALALAAPALAHAAPTPVTWCGTNETAADRLPNLDVSSADQVRFLYVVPSDGADAFLADASGIATDAAAIDAWWRGQDSTRTPRFDRYPFPNCSSQFGQLDIGFVRLAHPASYYTSRATPAQLLDEDLGTSLSPPTPQKTIVYYDGPIADPDVCGESDYGLTTSGGRFGFAYVYLRSSCDPGTPGNGATAAVAVHEFLHSLGAVPSGAPNTCPDSPGHVCDSSSDILYPFLTDGDTIDSKVLDVGRNDYYGHSGSWFDVQDSIWLAHLPLRHLHATVAGSGTIVASPATIACTSGCDVDLDDGTAVGLAGRPAKGWAFAGWSGDCSGVACSLRMDGSKSVTARFVRARVALRVAVRGRGRIVSRPAGISCPATCRAEFGASSLVRLAPKASKGFRFAGWGGACRGRGGCSVRLQRATAVTARFVPR